MEILYLLIPLSIALVFLIGGIFLWAVKSGQFEDLDHKAGYWGQVHAYSATGHLLMTRVGGGLYAMPYDLRARTVTGAPKQLLTHVSSLTISDNGILAYHEVRNLNSVDPVDLYTVDLHGRETPLTHAPENFAAPRISPDGQRVVLKRVHYTYGPTWIFEPTSQHFSLLIPDSTATGAEWGRDGRSVYYVKSSRDSSFIRMAWTDGRPDSVLAAGAVADKGDFRAVMPTRSGVLLAKAAPRVSELDGKESIVLIGERGEPIKAAPVTPPDKRIGLPTLSPDGQWMAYQTDSRGKRGEPDVFVTSMAKSGPIVRVSLNGGTEPVWSPDGRTIFYRSRDRIMMAARVTTTPLAVATRDSLFPDRYFRDAWLRNYDVMPDGAHLLMMRDSIAPLTPRQAARVVANWPAFLKTR